MSEELQTSQSSNIGGELDRQYGNEHLDAPPEPRKGFVLIAFYDTFTEIQALLRNLIIDRQLRCVSPLRSNICDQPADRVFYLDYMNYYGCCEEHQIKKEKYWTGTEPFSAHTIEIPIFNHDIPPVETRMKKPYRIDEYKIKDIPVP